jgi:uncharacterized protein (DUF58 family)
MNVTDNNSREGIEAGLADLIRVRPDRALTGFAPGGRVSTHQFGTNHSVFRGRGIEFDEARVYQPGDDVKAIDWRVTARTGTVHTKLFHEERERPVLVLVDCRSMMHFGSQVRFKSVMAAQIAAMLGWVGIDGGDRVGGFVLDQRGMQSFPASRNRSAMLTFLNGISAATQSRMVDTDNDTETPLHRGLRQLRHASRPGTLVFIVSDYADFDSAAEDELKRLSLRAHVTNILVYDQLDASLPTRGDYRVSDGDDVIALPGLGKTQLQDYQQAFHGRRERLETLSRRRRMAFMALATGDDPKTILTPHRKHVRRPNQWKKVA